MRHHTRNPAKDEYEIQHGSTMVFVGNREHTAVRKAVELLAQHPQLAGEKHVRLYHTYPSPGPTRRYVGTVDAAGLHRAV